MSDENKNENQKEQIKDMGGVYTKNNKMNIYCLSIVGQIEGHTNLPSDTKTTKYEHVIPKLVEIEQSDEVDGLLIMLNTVGGDVEAGLAIAEMIASMKKPTVSIVLGGGHSIGVPLAVSAKHSLIVPSATMTVHPIRTGGIVIGVHQMFDYLTKVQDRIIDFVERNSKIKGEAFKKIMLETGKIANDVGTILFGEEAVSCGLIDGVGGMQDAIEILYKMKEEKTKR
ncbi:MAG: ATP-dependent Clp protease proteolytic subunit [Clostridia bacterium]|nr:ATP-dependent Clp protease proteolytic subunit [Clostridia bacterium]